MKTTVQDKTKATVRGSAWRKARKKHLEEHPCCQVCGYDKKLEVHHIRPWSKFPELRTDPRNLATMDRACHFRFGHYGSWRDYNGFLKELLSSERVRDLIYRRKIRRG